VLDAAGRVVAEYRGSGADAMSSPASLVFVGRSLYITNLALFHGGVGQKLSVLTFARGDGEHGGGDHGNNDDQHENGDE
jgi:hypothetical protein